MNWIQAPGNFWWFEVSEVGTGIIKKENDGRYRWSVSILGPGGICKGESLFGGTEASLVRAKIEVQEILGLVGEYE